MQYFGIPTCPYCKKHVNLVRTWRLKREGEYKCPRCGGISNIYLSPLVYVFAVLAICAGVCIYFFHKFVLDDIKLFTCLQIFIPFATFLLFKPFHGVFKAPCHPQSTTRSPATGSAAQCGTGKTCSEP